MIDRIALLLLIIGGINWGLWAFSSSTLWHFFRRRCSDTKQDHLRFVAIFGYLVHFTVFQRQQTCHRAVVPAGQVTAGEGAVSEGSILSRFACCIFSALVTMASCQCRIDNF